MAVTVAPHPGIMAQVTLPTPMADRQPGIMALATLTGLTVAQPHGIMAPDLPMEHAEARLPGVMVLGLQPGLTVAQPPGQGRLTLFALIARVAPNSVSVFGGMKV
jgi:hypothetical protein